VSAVSGGGGGPGVRRAQGSDSGEIGRLLDGFNREFGDHTPGPGVLAERVRELLAAGDTAVLLAGVGPDGLALLRFRAGLWSARPECHLAELYVVPRLRGRGIGRALLDAAMELARERGAGHMDLGTSVDDVAARALYESAGFSNREGRPDGPSMLYYEREL